MQADHTTDGMRPEPAPAPEARAGGTALAPAARMLDLQRRAGNRAAGRLVAAGGLPPPRRRLARQPATKAKPQPRAVALTIVAEKPLTAHEFAVRVVAQLNDVSLAEAEARVAETEAAGERPGTGPHYDNGVRADEVGKPIRVRATLGGLTEGEAEDATARATQLAGLTKPQRDAIDAEADRRFFRKAGLPGDRKLTQGKEDAAYRELWLRTRDEVVCDRNRVDALPAKVRDFLVPGAREVPPEQYDTVLRIAGKLHGFSDEDWALYQRRVNASTDDYSRLEASVDRFVARQAADRDVKARVHGTESLYKLVKRHRELSAIAYRGVGGGATPMQSPQFRAEFEDARAAMETALHAAQFKDVAEYDAACAAYLTLFRSRAVELTLLALKASERIVQAEHDRYGDAAQAGALYAKQAALRTLTREWLDANRRTLPTMEQARVGHYKPNPAQLAAGVEAGEKHTQMEAERAAQVADHPILADPKLHTWKLDVPDAAALGALLRGDAADRLWDIRKTRLRVHDDADTIFQFDRVIALTLQELGAGPGSVGAEIVADRQKQIQADSALRSFAIAILALGLGALTFGTGTVAVLAGAGALTLSVYQAGDEWEKYSAASAAAHTAFDPKLSVSSDEPSPVWLALSLIAVGLDGAALVAALKAAGPAVRALQTTGKASAFEAELAKATELSEAVKTAAGKAARAEEEFRGAAEELSKALRASLGRLYMGGIDPDVIAKVVKCAYFAAKEGVRKFEVFLAKLQTQKFMKGIELEKLSAEQIAKLEEAFKTGVANFDAATPVFSVPVRFKSGTSSLTVGEKGELLLDGRLVGRTERDEVIKQLGLAHANRGHGALRDPVTIANEALQNALKPKGAGMSSIFASDETMLRSMQTAKADLAAGKGVAVGGGKTMVELPATPDTGRIFVANTKLPAGVTPLNATPLPNLAVSELQVTHVRALFEGDQLVDIFPAFKP